VGGREGSKRGKDGDVEEEEGEKMLRQTVQW